MLPLSSLGWAPRRSPLFAGAAALAISLGLQDPALAEAPALNQANSSGRHTAEIRISAPEISGSFLSLAVPGAGQFYAGNPVKAGAYFGAAALVGAGVYNLLISGVSEFEAKEARTQAFVGVIAYGAAFGVGIASTLDALADIANRHQAANEVLVPPAGPEIRPPRPAAPRRRGDDE